ncbi:polyamine ABC transporter substrate-binding protein [Pseudomonas sp. C2B4]|uniref:polyamine ABC transporter substrate-binding protein n=1 Tax=Pseudomonas sp. C2B4 TaxID=2735270 RepID=UPI001586BAC9|nr:polyamine ABC transporter substrate-binding protein [Pseudomonas sp. C2B4]NUU38214.1 polyamine ABC transporter substrate-binding protein [Pseudomonas sp. C2B4]
MKSSRLLHVGLLTFFGLGMGASWAQASSVNLYNWYDFIAPEAPKDFEKETGTPMVLDTFDSAEVMQSKLMVGRSGYDVVVVTSSTLPNLIKAGVLKELDGSQLSNRSNLDPGILAKVAHNDPGNRYAIPYLWGTTGIGYDVDKVAAVLGTSAPVDSWDLIFKEENIAKLSQCGVAMLDSPGEIIPIALHYLGLPPDSNNPDDYAKAQALLLKIRPYITYFDSSRFITDLANGNICAVVAWSGGVHDAKVNAERAKNGRQIAYRISREGSSIWVETMVLLKDAPHPEQGMNFINYMMRPEIIAKSTNYLGYPNGNKSAMPFVDEGLRNNPDVYPPATTLATLFPDQPLPLKTERIRTRVWSKVKSGT